MCEVCFWVFLVVFDCVDVFVVGDVDYDWYVDCVFMLVGEFGELCGDLVECGEYEFVELDFDYWVVFYYCYVDCGVDDFGFG